jgi:ubiquitin-associated SH3 domain-containing protein
VAELILYACPVGPLAEAIEAYWATVLATIGANSAHEYMPHVTLIGFFHGDAASVERHVATLTGLRAPANELRGDVRVTGALFGPSHHLLTVEAPKCRALADAFRERTTGVRVKDQLHISLAYGFQPTDGPALERLGTELVDPLLPAAWELRFYERRPDRTWQLHGCWPF